MADPDGELTVAQRLGRALDRGLLPAGGPAEAAERLIERLERPARVALLGLPGSGKSSILNLLVGAIVVPETLRLPTIIVQHGDVARMLCTLTDGTSRILPGHDLAEVLPLAPALVTLEMDLAALKVISLLEVSAGPMEAEQKRAATWASKRADIVIWCSTSYLPKEQAVWESLPDSVKDNSFMFLTKVDLLGNRESATAMHDRVELRAGEEFRQILSISAKQARAAMPPGGAVNRELFRDSGASAVIAAIKTRVQSGRRADTDTAELLLARHVEASELVIKRFAETDAEAAAPKAWTPPPEPDAEAAVAVETPLAEATEPAAEEAIKVEDAPQADAADESAFEPDEAAEAAPEAAVEQVAISEPEATDPPVFPAAETEMESPGRRRFADRIKRVATDGEAATAPMVPLKSTWKSKVEVEAAPEPEPAPVPRPSEPVRRPRASAQPVVEDAEEIDDLARTVANVVSALDAAASEAPVAVPEPDPEPAQEERRPRAVTPRPPRAEAEAPRTARPQLFGGRRPPTGGEPLPDLSSLRATPEEIAASAEAREQDLADDTAAPTAVDDDWTAPEAQAPVTAPPAARPDRSVRPMDRARPPMGPTPPAPDPIPRAMPVERTRPRSYEPTVAARPQTEDFSPRAIMMRDRQVEADAPAPRRERTRITARAQPATSAPPPPAPVSGSDQALVDEAINLILSRSAALEQEIDPDAKVPVDLILDHTRETGELMQAVVAKGQSEALRRINSDLGEVMDLILLMQLERGHAPADDALTLMLQLKRELETLRAV